MGVFFLNMKRNSTIKLKVIECDTNTNLVVLQTNSATFTLTSKDLVEFINTASLVKESNPPANTIHTEVARNILEYLNTKSGRSFQINDKNLNLIIARIRDGENATILKQVIDVKVWEWKDDAVYRKYLRPETLFNFTKFQSYKQQVLDIINNPEAFKKHVKEKENERNSKNIDPLDSMYSTR